jgi:hypothetical protein
VEARDNDGTTTAKVENNFLQKHRFFAKKRLTKYGICAIL